MPPTRRRTSAAAQARPNSRAGNQNGASSERRRAIVEIAADLFAERGFKATTVREIGDAAGLLSGSLYYHFDSKETIVDEILSTYLDSLRSTYQEIVAQDSDPATTLRNLVIAAFTSLGPHRAAITVLQNERNYLAQLPRFAYLTKAESDVRQLWIKVLADGIESGAFRPELDPGVTYRFLRDSVWVTVRWYVPSGRLTAEQLADQYLTLVMHGLMEP